MGFQMQFDEEKCTGCFACHIACVSTHFQGDRDAKGFRSIQKLVNEEENFQKNISPGCTHCGACMDVCPRGALFRDNPSGFVLYNQEKCTGCRTCEPVCPLHMIQYSVEGKVKKCDGCIQLIREGKQPACVRNCYADAIVLSEGLKVMMESIGENIRQKLHDFMEQIDLPDYGKKGVYQSHEKMTISVYQKWKQLFDENTEDFFRLLCLDENKEQLLLYLYVRFAIDVHGEFKKRNINDKVYYDTFKEITIWHKQCVKKKGICGLIEERWIANSLQLKLFRLGRLQFEPEILKVEKRWGAFILPAATGVLHVHIPEGEALTATLCRESFAQADLFFSNDYTIFDCWSWLLSPNLEHILSKDSNILKFQRMFCITETSYPFRQAESQVFGFVAEKPEQYPQGGTSLQRGLREYVMNGRDIGISYGYIDRRSL